eukprot:8234052-Lingulodinium_polyedra.AAC.1
MMPASANVVIPTTWSISVGATMTIRYGTRTIGWGGSGDQAWDDWSWSETWRGGIRFVGDVDALSTTSSAQLRGCAIVDALR